MGKVDNIAERKRRIQEMFNGIAPRYDLLNHLLSMGIDLYWRRRALSRARRGGAQLASSAAGQQRSGGHMRVSSARRRQQLRQQLRPKERRHCRWHGDALEVRVHHRALPARAVPRIGARSTSFSIFDP